MSLDHNYYYFNYEVKLQLRLFCFCTPFKREKKVGCSMGYLAKEHQNNITYLHPARFNHLPVTKDSYPSFQCLILRIGKK